MAQQPREQTDELAALRQERTDRAANGACAVLQESAMRARLEAEQRRLADSSVQLLALEAAADDARRELQERCAAEEREAHCVRAHAGEVWRAARALGRGAPAAWRLAYAHARVVVLEERRLKAVAELDEQMLLLSAARDSRDALEGRVTQQCASLIVLRSAAAADIGSPAQRGGAAARAEARAEAHATVSCKKVKAAAKSPRSSLPSAAAGGRAELARRPGLTDPLTDPPAEAWRPPPAFAVAGAAGEVADGGELAIREIASRLAREGAAAPSGGSLREPAEIERETR